MKIEDYFKSLGKLSEVKKNIITRLWKEGSSFPKGWVKSSELLKLTKQKYFDRRVRELRDETGCDIETSTFNGEHAYRLASAKLKVSNPRLYLSASQKKKLLENSQHTCAVCGIRQTSGIRGLQADHKIPLQRGGSHDIANWQILCVECNVGKRSACAGCNLDCHQCPWAFPELVGIKTTFSLEKNLHNFLNNHAKKNSISIGSLITDILLEFKKINPDFFK